MTGKKIIGCVWMGDTVLCADCDLTLYDKECTELQDGNPKYIEEKVV